MIRTSGEERISNFLLWQCAYAEFYFTPVLFPDFTKQCFDEALAEYAHRDRRMGGNTKRNITQISHRFWLICHETCGYFLLGCIFYYWALESEAALSAVSSALGPG